MSVIHIYAPQPDIRKITAGTCPDCKRRTRFIAFHVEWYGWDSTCLRCGRRWQNGEWMHLDFVRGSRQKSVQRAKARWCRISGNSPAKAKGQKQSDPVHPDRPQSDQTGK